MDGTAVILKQLEIMSARLDTIAADGSKRGHDLWEKLNEQGRDLAVLTHRFTKLEESVNGQALTLSEYQDLKKKAQGAGWLGQKLLMMGSMVLGLAGWIYASWSTIAGFLKWMIGRVL